ncbi:methionine--tRNA ligase [Acaricomes phytoseiuli]|uniref:methionine--tRNA ligase n=1 Tax=Acaricomes phytoseiuli TaxID=291968 RepID=UPI00036C3520|nr:methionine--tRNA ligase [Acaricomes phytoseiuli]MCW1249363.1 methionine--tRNA ligase [Acaricomes phytoseiuli]
MTDSLAATDAAETKTSFYVTTAISYPNGSPHIGHAYEFVSADALARFKRLDGFDVFYMTGTDEHGLKVQQAAQQREVSPKELVDQNSAEFRAVHDLIGSSYDRFIRTTDEDHRVAAQELWRRMEARGDIYLDKYSGWYSVRDEAYYTEEETELREVEGEAQPKRFAIATDTEVSWTEEESYFFRLSAYQDKLLEIYREQSEFAAPRYRFNEVISFVESGLQDLSISRTSFDWGIPVPGNDKHVMYVWVDALTNYLTGAGFPTDQTRMRRYWPADVHIIGKDISRFHAVYWPAFLMSAGIELPKRVMIHGFLFNNGVKMSKSLGNVVAPADWVEEYGLDAVRFFLLREVSYGQDGNYSHEAIVSRKNSDLANNLGNLAQRSLSMVAKNCQGAVPQPGAFTEADQRMLDAAAELLPINRAAYDVQEFHRALEAIWTVLGDANAYFAEQQPWVLRKTDPERMATVLYVTLEVLRIVALLIQAVMPESAAKLLDLLGVPESARDFTAISARLAPGTELPAPEPIFPRYEETTEPLR